ncbi:maleylpyruvate isomerase N-terminal domain-containing protein [Nocardioides sp. SYSU D00038]|uniref:maleylpyruvate isomerase N-terminal domain-containing protein n=1 Tax=Nocardioides sp. SYSU D00038 TaxID=2812554 RepID=UPI001967A257|nr:maleylpyruvate isomerase N-terminal domain-containing protein [Nocardioides sp. SYSU D00038]
MTSTRLPYDAYLAHLRRDSARFREVLTDVDPAARVPACPDWDAADLLWHLAEVQWFWARTVRLRPAPPEDDLEGPERPADHAGLLAAFDEFSAQLVAELEGADPADEAWHWAPERTVGTSHRRQAHEALVHRLDAEQTAGAVTPFEPALAADGVAEALEVMYGGAPPAWAEFTPVDGVLRLDLTDTGHTFRVAAGVLTGADPGSGKAVDGPHLVLLDPGTRPAATLAGTAADVDTWLWKRGDDARLVRDGDPAVHAAFAAAVSPPLT